MKTTGVTGLTFSKLTKTDVSGLIKLSASVGWDYDQYEIKTVLASGEIYGHKNDLGEIVSSAAIVPYENNLASLGMVIVHQTYRGFGLAKEVTKKCIDSVSSNTKIILISTEEGKPLYETLGFKSINRVHKYLSDTCRPIELSVKQNMIIEEYRDQDFEELVQLDSNAFGGCRRTLLVNRIKQSNRCLIARNKNREIIGFGLSILGSVHLLIGPIVAINASIATQIIHELTQHHTGKLRIDVPGDMNVEIADFLMKIGFEEVNQPPIMMRIATHLPKRNNQLYAISAQVFG
ncbi:GNAT family N-acetyltransferase [Bacillus sp. Marseille-P3800]|uniref:GNAT family N-acetyltransferase n=1 Tax=Bacillus sp. Marseille-P3800 TaxID=2014782 RepID=UPI000C07314E|nr:GNAT family N-acetyltransferase [Bacillus sp. Marseille-P3800]